MSANFKKLDVDADLDWTPEKKPQKHMLVVDDDPIFRRTMEAMGKSLNVHVTTCGTLRELSTLALPSLFDIAIVDYYLDDMKDNLKGNLVAEYLGATPVILVSRTERCVEDSQTWPSSVRKFVSKAIGTKAILETALHAVQK